MVRTLWVALCLVSLTCLGCGGSDVNLGEVTGKVTMDDKPLANVLVTFTPLDAGRASSAATKEDGTYTLGFGGQVGAVVGLHKVTVKSLQSGTSTVNTEMRSDSPEYQAQASGGSASDYDKAAVTEDIPAKYNTQTTLQYEVKAGKNTINIELTR